MHTEAEARKLWCPFARNWRVADKPIGGQQDAACIASECAAWRWAERFSDTRDGSDAVLGKTYEPGVLEEMGYCGLAGRP